MAIVSNDDIQIRLMQDAEEDYQYMLKWLLNDRIAENYGGRDQEYTLGKIMGEYHEKIVEKEYIHPCIIEYNGRPIGYLQFYKTTDEEVVHTKKPDLWLQRGTYNIDMFIGEPELWGQGIGSTTLRMMAEHLLHTGDAQIVTIDPKMINERAINAYQKAGFKKVEILPRWEEHEGTFYDAWLMQFEPGAHTLSSHHSIVSFNASS